MKPFPLWLLAAIGASPIFVGCGISTYSIEPFTDSTTHKLVCCRAIVQDGQDKGSVTVNVTNNADGTFNLQFSETGVNSTSPIAASAQTASAVAGAVTSAAGVAAQFAIKP